MTSREPREFLEDIRGAVVHRLELIGEAAGKLAAITGGMTSVPGAEIKSMRNPLVHQYWDIDLKLLWTVVHDDLPLLARAIEAHLGEE